MRNKTLEQNSAQVFAGLQVDLLQKLRNGNMTYEQIDWFRNLSFDQREKLMGEAIKNIEHPKMKLVDPNVAVVGLDFEEFNPHKHFNENKTIKYWKSDNFQKYVLNPAKTINNLSEMSFSKYKFTEIIYDSEIMKHFQISKSAGLMTREEILWVIASLTSKQPKGEAGDWLNNGYSTIVGYMLCDDGVVRAVFIDGSSYNKGSWRCSCREPSGWSAGNEGLSRN